MYYPASTKSVFKQALSQITKVLQVPETFGANTDGIHKQKASYWPLGAHNATPGILTWYEGGFL